MLAFDLFFMFHDFFLHIVKLSATIFKLPSAILFVESKKKGVKTVLLEVFNFVIHHNDA